MVVARAAGSQWDQVLSRAQIQHPGSPRGHYLSVVRCARVVDCWGRNHDSSSKAVCGRVETRACGWWLGECSGRLVAAEAGSPTVHPAPMVVADRGGGGSPVPVELDLDVRRDQTHIRRDQAPYSEADQITGYQVGDVARCPRPVAADDRLVADLLMPVLRRHLSRYSLTNPNKALNARIAPMMTAPVRSPTKNDTAPAASSRPHWDRGHRCAGRQTHDRSLKARQPPPFNNDRPRGQLPTTTVSSRRL
jgi:hypothetical protein